MAMGLTGEERENYEFRNRHQAHLVIEQRRLRLKIGPADLEQVIRRLPPVDAESRPARRTGYER